MATSQVWKKLLEQHDALVKKGGSILYDRVTLLQRVYEDKHYLSYVHEHKKQPMEILNEKVTDTCANFTELLQILKLFPARKEWETEGLYALRIKTIEHIRRQNNPASKPPNGKLKQKGHPRKTATLAEVREMKQEIKDRKTELERLREQLSAANQYIKTLEGQLEANRITIGSLNETISLVKLRQPQRV